MPYRGVRIVECGTILTGRLSARLFADQGAEVLVVAEDEPADKLNEVTTAYLDRGKTKMTGLNADEKQKLIQSADVVIVDGESTECDRSEKQIVLRVCAALPGDKKYGHLPHDCDDDLLSALTGFYTDMALSNFLDRKVVYTPLRLCSVYAGVLGAVATGGALVDRERTGVGREIAASRLAGGIAAIGALSLTIDGPNLPKHLISQGATYQREGLGPEELERIRLEAVQDPAKQLWLEQRLYPLASPYKCSDGSLFLPMATFNRGIARRLVEHVGIWEKLQELGIVDATAYDARNDIYRTNNLALPLNFSWQTGCSLAEQLEEVFKQKTAFQWEKDFCENRIPSAQVLSFEEWFHDQETRNAKLVADVEGQWQIGRSAWCESAKPYPPLKQGSTADAATLEALLDAKSSPAAQNAKSTDSFDPMKPLKGYTVVDFSNVLAGPACGRLMAEMGATVFKVGPKLPDHAPVVMVTWQAEEMIGKKSIMLDLQSERGAAVVRKLLTSADIALANKHDAQLEHIGISRDTLDSIVEDGGLGQKLIQLQVAARRGETATADGTGEDVMATNWPGYDPALQGKCGIMERFGPPGCPTFHGVASCVDYLCGYTAAFAGVTALFAREAHGAVQERAGTSLAACATLVQCTMQGGEQYPDTARGPWSRGRSSLNRVYQVGHADTPENAPPENWIFAQADRDLSSEAMAFTGSRDEYITQLSDEGILATPVHTCKQIADVSKSEESITLRFEKREAEGLLTETWKPTWLSYNGVPSDCPGAAAPSGVHAPQILMDVCGYTEEQVFAMYGRGTVLPIYWDKNNSAADYHVWPNQVTSSQRSGLNATDFKYDDPSSGKAM